MNNSQDNFNTNPQMNNPNFQPEGINNQSRFFGNINQSTNAIQENTIMNNQQNLNQSFATNSQFLQNNNNIQNQPTYNNFNNPQVNNNFEGDELNEIFKSQQNRFIKDETPMGNQTLNDMNIDGTYQNMPKVDYSQEPQVQANLKPPKTITITSEGKVFILIIIVLFLFIFIMPYIFDFFRNNM